MLSNWVHTKTEEDFQMNRMGRLSNRQYWALWSSIAVTFVFLLLLTLRILSSEDIDVNTDNVFSFLITLFIIIFISVFINHTHIRVLLNSNVLVVEGVVDTETYTNRKARFHYLIINDRKFQLSEKVYRKIIEYSHARVYYVKDDVFLGIEYLEKLA